MDKEEQIKHHYLNKGTAKQFADEVELFSEQSLGKGAFGEVYKGKIKASQKNVAVKIMTSSDPDKINAIYEELKNLNYLSQEHPHIIHCIGYYIEKSKEFGQVHLKAAVLFPLCIGSVKQLLDQGRIFSEADLEQFLQQCLSALSFLRNALKIFHRDIKPHNILILKEGHYALSDFGISKIVQQNELSLAQGNTVVGTKVYFSPEMLISYKDQQQEQTEMEDRCTDKNSLVSTNKNGKFIYEKCDIFSLGLTALQLASGLKSMSGLNDGIEGQKKRETLINNIVLKHIRLTIQGMLQQNPLERFSIIQSILTLNQTTDIQSIKIKQKEFQYQTGCKIVVIGPSGAGKTTLVNSFLNIQAFTTTSTLQVEYLKIQMQADDEKKNLIIFDTAGQQMFRDDLKSYIRGAKGLILLYDISDRQSFSQLDDFKNQIDDLKGLNSFVLLLGNKCDREHSRQITYQQGKQFADKNEFAFIEISAMVGQNMKKFYETLNQLINVHNSRSSSSSDKDDGSIKLKAKKFQVKQGSKDRTNCC